MKILLSSVIGPYGVNDDDGVAENKMELFHNQVTREQGIFSYRFNHNTQGLYFLAENIQAPTTILDFPSKKQFKKELKKNYDYIGISFIVPNFQKAQKMAKMIRQYAPQTKIIFGGHGTKIPYIESFIEYDYICKEEGVSFMRKLLGEELDTPIKHPLVYSSFNRMIMGVPLKEDSGILSPGVGCANKCRFCSTSHFFGDYVSYLSTGKELYDVCCRYEDELGVTDFGVLDENFLKMPERAMELLELMESNNRFFTFSIFSSAETIQSLENLDILPRLGIQFIWIGVESQKEVYLKNKDVDFKWLFAELQKRGISVLASSIMFLEDHDKKTIWEDVDYAISLNPDYLQFMELGPMPGTPLHDDYKEKGLLRKDVPYKEHHGQDKIWFNHPHFSREDSAIFLQEAFNLDYEANGASLLRALKTHLAGVRYFKNSSHPTLHYRAKERSKFLVQFRYLLLACSIFKENKKTAQLIRECKKEFRDLLGPLGIIGSLISIAATFFTAKEYLRVKLFGDRRDPKFFKVEFNQHQKQKKSELALLGKVKTLEATFSHPLR